MEIPLPLEFEEIIPAPIEAVWQAWTTAEGVRSFFAPQCTIDLRPGGAYEMYFDLEAASGLRGSEGCVVLAIEEPYMLSFTWNAPPELPRIRDHHTHVTTLPGSAGGQPHARDAYPRWLGHWQRLAACPRVLHPRLGADGVAALEEQFYNRTY